MKINSRLSDYDKSPIGRLANRWANTFDVTWYQAYRTINDVLQDGLTLKNVKDYLDMVDDNPDFDKSILEA